MASFYAKDQRMVRKSVWLNNACTRLSRARWAGSVEGLTVTTLGSTASSAGLALLKTST